MHNIFLSLVLNNFCISLCWCKFLFLFLLIPIRDFMCLYVYTEGTIQRFTFLFNYILKTLIADSHAVLRNNTEDSEYASSDFYQSCVCAQLLSHIWLFPMPWIVAHQASLANLEFSKTTGTGFSTILQLYSNFTFYIHLFAYVCT